MLLKTFFLNLIQEYEVLAYLVEHLVAIWHIVEENKIGWVAAVENYTDLNEKVKEISKLSSLELLEMKKTIFYQSQLIFNLDNQMNFLIAEKVF